MSNVEVLIVERAAVDALPPCSIEIGEVPTLDDYHRSER